MNGWHEALRSYRRRPLAGALPPAKNVMFIVCSEHAAAATLAAACDPAMVLQVHAASFVCDESVRATIELAIESRGVRHLVVCGHSGCSALAAAGRTRGDAQRAVLAQCERLVADAPVARMLHARDVTVRALWFDEHEGDVYECPSARDERPRLLSDSDFGAMLASFAPCSP